MENSEEVSIPDKEGITITVADGNDNSEISFIDMLWEPYQVDTTSLVGQ